MTRPLDRLALASGILLLASLIAPGVVAVDCFGTAAYGQEDFENDTLSVDPTDCWYTTAATGGNNYVVSTPAQGTKALRIGGGSPAVDLALTDAGNWCHNGASATWAMRATSLGTAQGGSGAGAGAFNKFVLGFDGVSVKLTGNDIAGAAFSGAVVPAFTWAVDTWYYLTISISDAPDSPNPEVSGTCNNAGPSHICGTIAAASGGTPSAVCFDKTFNGAASSNFQHFVVSGNAALIYLDDINITGFPTYTPGSRFCASLDNPPDFGYEYRAGVSEISGPEDSDTISMEDGFKFSGHDDADSWDFTAKHFPTGSKAMHVFSQIEAATDTTNSVFRVAFTLENNAAPTGTTKGNGLSTQLFNEDLEVRFTEAGSHWNIQMFQVLGGTRTTLGPSASHGNPNNPTLYEFRVDTRAGANYAAVIDGAGHDILNTSSPSIDDVPAGFQDDPINDQWYIGYGDNIALNSVTALNNNEGGSGNSTCIYDDIGSAVVGAGGSGGAPETDIPDGGGDGDGDSSCTSFLCVDSTTVPEGFTASTFNLFLGVLLMLSIGVGVFLLTKNTLMGVGGTAGGFLIAFAFGLIPLWVIVGLVIIAVAVIFIQVKRGATGG